MTACTSDAAIPSFAGDRHPEGAGDTSPSLVASSQTSPPVETPCAPGGGSLSAEDAKKLQDWLNAAGDPGKCVGEPLPLWVVADAFRSWAFAMDMIGAWHNMQGTRPVGGYFTQAH